CHLRLEILARQGDHSGGGSGGSAGQGGAARARCFGGLSVERGPFAADGPRALPLEQNGGLLLDIKRGGQAGFTCATGAADSMDEVFGFLREVVVDDVRDVVHVDATSGDVGGYEDAIMAALESC